MICGLFPVSTYWSATLRLAAGQLQGRHQATCQYCTTPVLHLCKCIKLIAALALWDKATAPTSCFDSAPSFPPRCEASCEGTNDSLEEE